MVGTSGQHPTLRVMIHGVSGRMGKEVRTAVVNSPDMEFACGIRKTLNPTGDPNFPTDSLAPIFTNMEEAVFSQHPNVMVDFSNAAASLPAVEYATTQGISSVVGTTGLDKKDLVYISKLAEKHGVGVIVAPNFAIGAVLLIHLAKNVGRFFDFAEIVESHHEAKVDAPSGTAITIADALRSGHESEFIRPTPEKETLQGSRGAGLHGISIHAMRMPGQLARHEVTLGTNGQTLSIRHDTINRQCYMPGVLAAIRKVIHYRGIVFGLDTVLEL